MKFDYVLITALLIIPALLLLRQVNDWIFVYYQYLALPIGLPIP